MSLIEPSFFASSPRPLRLRVLCVEVALKLRAASFTRRPQPITLLTRIIASATVQMYSVADTNSPYQVI